MSADTNINNYDETTYQAEPSEQTTRQPAAKRGGWRAVAAILSAVLSVAAWCVFYFYPVLAVVLAVVSVVLAIVGVTLGRGCLREVAITAIVASGVLIAVYCVFYWGVAYAVDKL